MQETISIIMKQYFPHQEEFDVIKALLLREKDEPSPLPYGVVCYLYGTIQGKRQERARRKKA